MTPCSDVDGGPPGRPGTDVPPAVQQKVVGFDQAQQASQGAGVQHNYFGNADPQTEPAVSIAPPVGQLDERLPLRGRDTLLATLTDTTAGLRVKVVHGLGGCGKTRLALEAASLAQERGADVWWVSASDESRLAAGMHAVGRRLGVTDSELRHGEAADLVWRQLARREQAWLLVIDSADDPQVLAGPSGRVGDGTGWLRPLRSPTGITLVTSRDGRASSWGPWCGLCPVKILTAGEAAQVLADYAGGGAELGSAGEAEALAGRLGRLPLALKLAGSFLAESAAVPAAFADPEVARTYSQYRETIERGQVDRVFPAPFTGELTPEQARSVIGRTWELTLDLLAARHMPEARRILRLLACMADAPIPYELLLHSATLAGSPLLEGISGSRLWQVMQTLAGFGLIDLPGGGGNLPAVTRLHPLVRDTSHPGAGGAPGEYEAYLTLAAQLLGRAAVAEETGWPEDLTMWPIWQSLAPHAFHVFKAITSCQDCPDEAATAAADAAGLAARYQQVQGLYPQAESALRAVLTIRLRVLGPDHPHTLTTRHAIASVMDDRGNYAGAEAEYRDVLAARLPGLGPDHPTTLAIRYEIARTMAEQGHYAEAEAEYRDVLAVEMPELGPDHPDMLITRHAIASVMDDRGNYAGAEAEYREILAAWLPVLGPDHPTTLTIRHEIARMMAEQGHHAEAEAEHRNVLAARLAVQGPDHPHTLTTRNAIARTMAAQGHHAEAEAEHREVLAAERRVLGPDHPTTLNTRNAIARTMAAQGHHAEAEAEYREVLAARLRVLGPDHPHTLTTRHEIASTMDDRGNYAGAEAEYREVLAARLRVLGPDHPHTLNTRNAIARTMAAQGHHAEAEAEYREVLAARLRVLGPDHPDTQVTRHAIARRP
jgi:tetratricopeptide (TPR) repeat protein